MKIFFAPCYGDMEKITCFKRAIYRAQNAPLQVCESIECRGRLQTLYGKDYGKIEWVKISWWSYFRYWLGGKVTEFGGRIYGDFWNCKTRRKKAA